MPILFFIIFICVVFFSTAVFTVLSRGKSGERSASVCIKGQCFHAEIADNFFKQSRGMMFRDNLDQNKGMLFVFKNEGLHSFWMKNTLIPLDIIWINEENKIVYVKEKAPPCKQSICPEFVSVAPAKYVLEVNAGIAEKAGIEAGDTAEISF